MSASLVTCSMRVRMRMWMRMRLRMRISAPSVSALVFLLSRLSLIVRRISERRYQIEFVSSNSLFRFSVVSRRLRSASRCRECLLFRGGPSERVLVPPIDGKDVFADKSDFAEKSCSRESREFLALENLFRRRSRRLPLAPWCLYCRDCP